MTLVHYYNYSEDGDRIQYPKCSVLKKKEWSDVLNKTGRYIMFRNTIAK
jgi:hypothetical protein